MKKRHQKAASFVAIIVLPLLLILTSICGPLKLYHSNVRTSNTGLGMVAAYQPMEPRNMTIDDLRVLHRTPLPEKLVSILACRMKADQLVLLFTACASIGMRVMPLPFWPTPALSHVRLDE